MAFLAHETNSFSPIPTDLSSFGEAGIYRPAVGPPDQHISLLKGVADFYAEAKRRNDVAVVGLCAIAQPSLPCRRNDYESLRDEILEGLRAAMPVDMVLLMLHGSMMAQGYDDCEGDIIEIDIPTRKLHLAVDEATLAKRREAMLARGAKAWKPVEKRERMVSTALRAYAAFALSASEGAARDIDLIERQSLA